MKTVLVTLFLLVLGTPAYATAQLSDKIVVDGVEERLFTNPLDPALAADKDLAERFRLLLPKGMCTAAWRGYVASWEVREQRLFLTKVEVTPCSNATALPLNQVFPDAASDVPATWFSGQLTIPQGKQVKYIHMGYQSRSERYLVLTVERGEVVGREIREEP